MKRSQMLGKLYTLLYKETDLNEDSLKGLCIKILNTVENSGMTPPIYIYKSERDVFNNTECNDWEEE